MKGLKKLPLAIAITSVFAATAQAELKALEDETMSEMTGQAGITVEMSVTATVGQVQYTDTDGDGTVGADSGSIAFNNVKLGSAASPLKVTQTIDVVDDYQSTNAAAAGDAIKLGISNLTVNASVGGIQIGKGTGNAQLNETIGGLVVENLTMGASDTYVYALNGEKGIGVDQSIKVTGGNVTYVAGFVDAADETAFTDANAGAPAPGYYNKGADADNRDTDGVGSISLEGITFNDGAGGAVEMDGLKIQVVDGADTTNTSTTKDAILVTSPSITGTLTIQDIKIGSGSVGQLAITDINMAGSTTKIYAH